MQDQELIRRALENPNNYALIVERFEKSIFRFVQTLSKLSHEDAEDLTQQVFIKAYEHLNDFDRELKLSSWLFRIARNEVISFWRYKQARPQESELDETIMNTAHMENTMAKDMDLMIQSEQVSKILSLLQPEYREVLYLYYFEEKSYEEMSDIIRCPSGTVAALLSRAKKAFSDLAQRMGSELVTEKDVTPRMRRADSC